MIMGTRLETYILPDDKRETKICARNHNCNGAILSDQQTDHVLKKGGMQLRIRFEGKCHDPSMAIRRTY